MTVLYPNLCYSEVYYKVIALYLDVNPNFGTWYRTKVLLIFLTGHEELCI